MTWTAHALWFVLCAAVACGGRTAPEVTPAPVELGVTSDLACAWRRGGDAWCWGVASTTLTDSVRLCAWDARPRGFFAGTSLASLSVGHTLCAVDGRGGLDCMGGFASRVDAREPVARAVSWGGSVCAITLRRGLRCWSLEGELRFEDTPARVTDVGASASHVCVRAEGAPLACACLAAPSPMRFVTVPTPTPITGFVAIFNDDLGLRGEDGALYVVRPTSRGECAPRVAALRPAPTPEHLTLLGPVCYGERDGTVRCEGINFDGALGDGAPSDRTFRSSLVRGLSGVRALAANGQTVCAVQADGVWCWGSNRQGLLGLEPMFSREPIDVPGVSGVRDLACERNRTAALLADGSLDVWPDGASDFDPSTGLGRARHRRLRRGVVTDAHIANGRVCVAHPDRSVECLDLTLAAGAWLPVPALQGAVTFVPGMGLCALLEDGTFRCTSRPNIGDGTPDLTLRPPRPVTRLRHASGGLTLVLNDGSILVRRSPNTLPVEAAAAEVRDATDALVLFNRTLCYVDRASVLRCRNVAPPGDLGWRVVARGVVETVEALGAICGRFADGGVRCVGGLLTCNAGDPSALSPVPRLQGAVKLVGSDRHLCGLLPDGRVRCAGFDDDGRLGDPRVDYASLPQRVPLP